MQIALALEILVIVKRGILVQVELVLMPHSLLQQQHALNAQQAHIQQEAACHVLIAVAENPLELELDLVLHALLEVLQLVQIHPHVQRVQQVYIL